MLELQERAAAQLRERQGIHGDVVIVWFRIICKRVYLSHLRFGLPIELSVASLLLFSTLGPSQFILYAHRLLNIE